MKQIPHSRSVGPKEILAPLSLVALILGLNACSISSKASRVGRFNSLYDEKHIVTNFRSMPTFVPSRTIHKGDNVFEFGRAPRDLPYDFVFRGEKWDMQKLLQDTWTTGLIVIKDDHILFEDYYLGNTPETLNISWSMGKSFVSSLVGIAIEEGLIESVEVPVSDIAIELKDTAYNGVRLKDVLQMSSGVRFDEDYVDYDSDINRLGRTIALGKSINRFVGTLEPQRQPGTFNHYNSMDTQVLGIVLKASTGKTLSEYMEEKLWKKLGMQSDAEWLIDDEGMELAMGTLNVTLRDYARFGRLYERYGDWDGDQIMPRQWIIDSTTPDAPHLMPGARSTSDYRMGYGYQWWIPENPKGDYMALGIYGQYTYINPGKNIVIVKTSADPNWRDDLATNDIMMAWFQHLAETL